MSRRHARTVPHPAEEALLQMAAGTAARREEAGNLAPTLLPVADEEVLMAELERQQVVAGLGARLVALAGGRMPALERLVAEALAYGARQAFAYESLLSRVQGVLATRDIRAIPLKGYANGVAIYGDPSRRTASDLDLLVSPAQLEPALAALGTIGFHAEPEPLDRRGRPLLHRRVVAPGLPPVEVHWRVHWYEERFADDLVRTTRPDPALGWRPAPAAELATLLLFYARDGFSGLKLALDASAWWDRYGADLPTGALAEIAAKYPELAPALAAASDALTRVVGLPDLGLATVTGRRIHLAASLANPFLRGGATQVWADAGLADALVSPPRQLGQVARRWLLPPPELLEVRYPGLGARGRLRVRMTQALTPLQVLRRWGLAVPRLARPARLGKGAYLRPAGDHA